MKKGIVLLCISLLIISCKEKLPRPTVLIGQEKMEEVLFDLAILYGIHGSGVYYRDSVEQTTVNAIYKKHGIDSITFVENNNYYINLPKGEYLDLQNAVLKRLEGEKEKIDSLYALEPVLEKKAALDLDKGLGTTADTLDVIKKVEEDIKPQKVLKIVKEK